jgi:hypothetical protein
MTVFEEDSIFNSRTVRFDPPDNILCSEKGVEISRGNR